MSSGKRRLAKLSGQLTPKQAFLLWMQDAHQHATMTEYARSLKGQPDSAWPLPRLARQMESSVTQALKGQPKDQLARTLRQADRDVLFLFYLHQQVNSMVLERERYFASHSLLLAQQLSALGRERMHQDQALWHRVGVALHLPYPLDSETAAAVDAAIQHHVIPWEALAESDELYQWVMDSFLAQGRTRLPLAAYRLRQENPGSEVPDLDEVRALFRDEDSFQKFLAGEDFSHGLADVSDAEFEAHYETIVSAIKSLGLEGAVVELPTVPHAFLREAALIDEEWIDAYLVALAEWGARLARQGYTVEESDDPHPLAWHRIIDSESGEDADQEETLNLWRQARQALARFPGRTQEIEGRAYLNWEDYLGWRGRRVKGDLRAGVSQGLMVSWWNRWVDSQGGDGQATLVGAPVGRLSSYGEDCQYRACQDAGELEGEMRRRRSLLDCIWNHQPGSRAEERFRERALRLRELLQDFLMELFTLRQTVHSIDRRYFEGQQGLFPKVAEGFEELVHHTVRLVGLFKNGLAGSWTNPLDQPATT